MSIDSNSEPPTPPNPLHHASMADHHFNLLKKYKSSQLKALFIFSFAAIGTILIFVSSAQSSRRYAVVEPELGATTGAATPKVVNDSKASGGKYIKFDAPTVANPPGSGAKTFVHPGVVFTKSEIDSWQTSNPEYARLANTSAGSLTNTSARFKPIVYGTVINGPHSDTSSELNFGFRDQSGFAKVQAVLWAADNNQARKDKVIAYLKEYSSVLSFEDDPVKQHRLTAGWGCTNIAQAAEIINYQDQGFKRFLKDVCYPVLDWVQGHNWHASFADSRLAIAAYLGDENLWQDAKNYFYTRIKQSIYHSKYDGNKIVPLTRKDGSSDTTLTLQHWGGYWGKSQVKSDFTFDTSVGPAVDGTTAERIRDYGHVNMGLGGWMQAARTIRAQGETLEAHAYDRIRSAYDYHSGTVYSYIQTGVFPTPVPYNKDTNSSLSQGAKLQGYYGAKTLFGSSTPQSVLNMLSLSYVKNYPAGGANHLVAEAFAK